MVCFRIPFSCSHISLPLFQGSSFEVLVRSVSCLVKGMVLMRSAFAGSAADYNKLVDEELDAIQTALDGVSDSCDNLDYDIAVRASTVCSRKERRLVDQHGRKGQLRNQQAEPE